MTVFLTKKRRLNMQIEENDNLKRDWERKPGY